MTSAALPRPRAAMAFILVNGLLNAMGFGLVVPVLPRLVAELAGDGIAAAGGTYGALVASYAALLFLCAPLLGHLSDRFGRRPVILLALAAAIIDNVVAAVTGSLALLFVARAVAGACGANAAAAAAYIADVTPPDQRGRAYALAGAVFGLGFILGPALGGLLGEWGPRLPFWAAAGLTAGNFLYGWLVLPESLAPAERQPLRLAALNPLASLSGWHQSRLVRGMLGAFFCFAAGQSAIQATWVLFVGERLGWGSGEVGLSLATLGIGAILAQGVLAPRLIARLGEPGSLVLGLCFTILASLGFALVWQGWQVYALIALVLVAFVAGPAAQAIVSKAAGAGGQGRLQGAVSGVSSLASIVGPVGGAAVFAAFAGPPWDLPGAGFLLAALFTGLALACALWGLAGRR